MATLKVYTKVGDKGRTMLVTGAKVSKSAIRIETYGTVDELNAFVGLLRDTVKQSFPSDPTELDTVLGTIQNELFDLGSELATPSEALDTTRQKVVDKSAIARLEQEIDRFTEELEPLRNFVLPGGHLTNSQAHVCRTVCRRAERVLVRLREEDPTIRPDTQVYLNRLSDWFFTISRVLTKRLDAPEVIWSQSRTE